MATLTLTAAIRHAGAAVSGKYNCLFLAYRPHPDPLSENPCVQTEDLKNLFQGFAEVQDIKNGERCNGALCWTESVIPPKFPTGAEVIFGGPRAGSGEQGAGGVGVAEGCFWNKKS